MYNRMKPPYFSLNIRLLFLIYFGTGFGSGFESGFESGLESGSEMFISVPDPAKSFGSLRIRIRFRIRNTGTQNKIHYKKTTWDWRRIYTDTQLLQVPLKVRPARMDRPESGISG